MTLDQLQRILTLLAVHMPNSGSVGDLRHLVMWMRSRPADFDSAIAAINRELGQ